MKAATQHMAEESERHPPATGAWDDQGEITAQEHPVSAPPPVTGGHVSTQRPMSEAQLRALCQQLLNDLNIVPPLTPEILCKKLGAARRRRIKLVAGELHTTASVGHLIAKERRDVIAYQEDAPQPQQAQVIYHEVMHLVRGHLDGAEDSLTCGALEGTGEGGADEGLYARWQEWEAETGATILSEMGRRRTDPRLISKDASPSERGIAATFGLSTDGWRR